MKSTKFFSAIMLFAAIGFAACNQGPIIPPDPEDTNPTDTTTTPEEPVEGEIITVAQALEIIDGLAETAETDEQYQIQGTVKVLTKAADIESGKYSNLNYDLTDATGTLRCAFTNGLNNEPVTSVDQIPADGTELILKGKLKKYAKDGKITPEMVNGYIVKIVKEGTPSDPGTPTEVVNDGSQEKPYSAGEVITLNNAQAGPFFVKGIIVGQIANGGKSMDNAEYAAPFSSNDKGLATNILIADAAGETNTANIVPVQLPAGMRDFSLPAVPDNLGKEIIVYGSLEAYFGQPGVKSITYAKVGDKEYGTLPQDNTGALLSETLLTQASFNKFTVVNVSGDLTWELDEKYGAKMSGYADNKTSANEDWFISPAIDLTGKDVVLSFDHARGPAGSMSVAVEGHYTVWATNDLNGSDAAAVAAATWTELQVPTHGTSAWSYVNSGNIAIPEANRAANFRFAFKYVCDDNESATWEIKNVLVK